jgi:uncharacterized protein with gpF-like domain
LIIEKLIANRFSKEQDNVINAINKSDLKNVTNNALKEIDKQEADWVKMFKALYLSVGEEFAKETYDNLKKQKSIDLKGNVDSWLKYVLEWLKLYAGNKIVNILKTTKETVRAQLEEGVRLGESIKQLAKRIDTLYLAQIIKNRSIVIARTEVIAASNLGNRAGALSTGLKLDKEWISTRDKRTRSAHEAADGQRTNMEKPYTVMGEKLMFPGDTSLGAGGSNTIQCRCTEGYHAK